MSRGSKNYYCGTFCWGTLQLTSCAISWQTKWRNLLVTMWNMQKWTFRTTFFLNEVSICLMAKVGGTILSRTTIISQSVQISYWPTELMIQYMWLVKRRCTIFLVFSKSDSLYDFSYMLWMFCLYDYIYEKRSSFLSWLVYRATQPDPLHSFPHIVLFAQNFFLSLFWSFEPKVLIFWRKVSDT